MKTSSFLTAAQVRQRYSISRSTLWSWLKSPDLGFPQPVKLGRRKYWTLAAVELWEADQAAKAPAARLPSAAVSSVIVDYKELVDALQSRRLQLGMTFEVLDERSGLQAGYSTKILSMSKGPNARALGKLSLPLMLEALGCGLVLVEQPDRRAA